MPAPTSATSQPKSAPTSSEPVPAPKEASLPTGCPRRKRNSPEVLTYDRLGTNTTKSSASTSVLFASHTVADTIDSEAQIIYDLSQDAEPHLSSQVLHSAFKAKVNQDPDILSYDQAMNDLDNLDEWKKAAMKEIRELEQKGTWIEVPISEAKTKVLPGTWVFRKKQSPDGTIKKFKARYCCRGDLETKDESADTYAPFVAFSTIHTYLVVSLMLRWKTVSLDFSNAFVQAFLKKPVWIYLPMDFLLPSRFPLASG